MTLGWQKGLNGAAVSHRSSFRVFDSRCLWLPVVQPKICLRMTREDKQCLEEDRCLREDCNPEWISRMPLKQQEKYWHGNSAHQVCQPGREEPGACSHQSVFLLSQDLFSFGVGESQPCELLLLPLSNSLVLLLSPLPPPADLDAQRNNVLSGLCTLQKQERIAVKLTLTGFSGKAFTPQKKSKKKGSESPRRCWVSASLFSCSLPTEAGAEPDSPDARFKPWVSLVVPLLLDHKPVFFSGHGQLRGAVPAGSLHGCQPHRQRHHRQPSSPLPHEAPHL